MTAATFLAHPSSGNIYVTTMMIMYHNVPSLVHFMTYIHMFAGAGTFCADRSSLKRASLRWRKSTKGRPAA